MQITISTRLLLFICYTTQTIHIQSTTLTLHNSVAHNAQSCGHVMKCTRCAHVFHTVYELYLHQAVGHQHVSEIECLELMDVNVQVRTNDFIHGGEDAWLSGEYTLPQGQQPIPCDLIDAVRTLNRTCDS